MKAMFVEISHQNNRTPYKERPKSERRRVTRREEDKLREQAQQEKARKLHSLLELGQLIGLDLQLNDMLLQIAQKACEVMEADRCSVFLHDLITDELWSTVALGMGGEVIRIPSRSGLAGACFQSGETIILEDVYQDPRFNKEVDAHTGYHTRSMLCMPLYNRAGMRLGVIELLNKKDGIFNKEDEAFLKTFGNHASFFIEMAQLQKARIDALEHSRKELERLNRAKSKALDHLSHELRTPLAVIQGNIRLLKRKLQKKTSPIIEEKFFKTLEKHLNRLLEIQQETDKIIRSYQELEGSFLIDELDQLWEKMEAVAEIPMDMKTHWKVLKGWMIKDLPGSPASLGPISLFSAAEEGLEKIKQRAKHRNIHFQVEGTQDLSILMSPRILEDVLEGLLKNAIENTPDQGMIRVYLEPKGQKILLKVKDFGVGITEENQRSIFDGLFHTQDTELYTSKKPYDFNAGGKGLDLLRMRVYGQRFGFDLSMESRRCIYLPTNRDLCPGRISACTYCRGPQDCISSGGSTFTVSFPVARRDHHGKI